MGAEPLNSRHIVLAALALLAGCRDQPEQPKEGRPDWSRHTVDGLAPLMSPAAVERVLAERGYKAAPCGRGVPIPPDALRTSDALSICYENAARNWQVSMHFQNLIAGRVLAVISFKDADIQSAEGSKIDRATRIARNAAFRRKLFARFGQPTLTTGEPPLTFHRWMVPGGSEMAPDHLLTLDVHTEGRNIEMNSAWAFSQPKAKRAADTQ